MIPGIIFNTNPGQAGGGDWYERPDASLDMLVMHEFLHISEWPDEDFDQTGLPHDMWRMQQLAVINNVLDHSDVRNTLSDAEAACGCDVGRKRDPVKEDL